MSLEIIFEDDHFVAVEKPAGLLSQAALDPARPDATRALEMIRSPVFLLHRLDAETSGLLLFARNREAAEQGRRLFSERSIRKTYFAVVADGKTLRESWSIRNHLEPEGSGAKMRMVSTRSGGDRAETEFFLRERKGPWALIEARPLTGRRHQIRAHLAQSGHPIWGDLRYGGPRRSGGFLLHASSLRFKHPFTGQEILLSSPLPASFRSLGFQI